MTLESLAAQDARDWYCQVWYAPNNATVIVAGDVKAQQVYDKVVSLYADWQRKPLPLVRSTAGAGPDRLTSRSKVSAAS